VLLLGRCRTPGTALLGAVISAGIYSVIQIPVCQTHAALPVQQDIKLMLARNAVTQQTPETKPR